MNIRSPMKRSKVKAYSGKTASNIIPYRASHVAMCTKPTQTESFFVHFAQLFE